MKCNSIKFHWSFSWQSVEFICMAYLGISVVWFHFMDKRPVVLIIVQKYCFSTYIRKLTKWKIRHLNQGTFGCSQSVHIKQVPTIGQRWNCLHCLLLLTICMVSTLVRMFTFTIFNDIHYKCHTMKA